MRKFKELTNLQKSEVRKRFILPENKNEILIDKFNRPFELISGAKVACTIRNNNFHVHGNKQNR